MAYHTAYLQEIRASIEPQVIASEMLSKVAIRSSDKELFRTYQIPNRLARVSSALEACGGIAEPCAAMAVASWCSIEIVVSDVSSEDEEIEGDSAAEEMLLRPEGAILDSEGQREDDDLGELSQIFGKLARAYVESRKPSAEQSPPDCKDKQAGGAQLSTVMKGTLVGKVFEASCASTTSQGDTSRGPVRLLKLLHCAVWNQKRYEEELSASRIADIVREATKTTAKIISKCHLAAEDEGYESFSHGRLARAVLVDAKESTGRCH